MLDAANYTISGPGAGDRVTPDNVAYVNGQSYDLTWSNGSFERAEMLTVTASQAIEDAGGDPIVAPLSAVVYVPDGDWQFVGGSTETNEPRTRMTRIKFCNLAHGKPRLHGQTVTVICGCSEGG